jgi:hypothetical protein
MEHYHAVVVVVVVVVVVMVVVVVVVVVVTAAAAAAVGRAFKQNCSMSRWIIPFTVFPPKRFLHFITDQNTKIVYLRAVLLSVQSHCGCHFPIHVCYDC